MPGHYVHAVFTSAVYVPTKICAAFPDGRIPIPTGATPPPASSAGSLLYMSDSSQDMKKYDVYHTEGAYGLGPFHQSFTYLGKVSEVYGIWADREWVKGGWLGIFELCGHVLPVTEIYVFKSFDGMMDLYARSVPQVPRDMFQSYKVAGDAPEQWWRARNFVFCGPVRKPEWDEPLSNL